MRGVTRATLSNLINGRAEVSPEVTIRLAKPVWRQPGDLAQAADAVDLTQADEARGRP
jgi:plasmid maintenance system antidote protein VapI